MYITWFVWFGVYMYIYFYICIYIYIRICECIYTCTIMYIYIYIHIPEQLNYMELEDFHLDFFLYKLFILGLHVCFRECIYFIIIHNAVFPFFILKWWVGGRILAMNVIFARLKCWISNILRVLIILHPRIVFVNAGNHRQVDTCHLSNCLTCSIFSCWVVRTWTFQC